MSRVVLVSLVIAFLSWAGTGLSGDTASRSNTEGTAGTPVVVELFTSEGCSSCPPADLLLQKLDAQPVPGAQLIVLSEHVDYWNHIGWTDPYSSAAYSERQSVYGNRLRLDSVYTPQMIVDGTDELGGSNSGEAGKALEKAVTNQKIQVRISGATVEGNVVRARLETGTLLTGLGKVDVVFIVALNHAESQVARGENSGRRLTHVAVVRSLAKIGSVDTGHSFAQDVTVKLENAIAPTQLRVIALIQEPGQGRILGAAAAKLSR
jgi:hypothetical protein